MRQLGSGCSCGCSGVVWFCGRNAEDDDEAEIAERGVAGGRAQGTCLGDEQLADSAVDAISA